MGTGHPPPFSEFNVQYGQESPPPKRDDSSGENTCEPNPRNAKVLAKKVKKLKRRLAKARRRFARKGGKRAKRNLRRAKRQLRRTKRKLRGTRRACSSLVIPDRPLETAKNGGRFLDGGIRCAGQLDVAVVYAFDPYMLAYDWSPGEVDFQYVAWRPWWYYKVPGGSWRGLDKDYWGWRYAQVSDQYAYPLPTYYDFNGVPSPTAPYPNSPNEAFIIPPGITEFIVGIELYWYPHEHAGWAYTVQAARRAKELGLGTQLTEWSPTYYFCGRARLFT